MANKNRKKEYQERYRDMEVLDMVVAHAFDLSTPEAEAGRPP